MPDPCVLTVVQVPVEPHLQVRVQWDQSERVNMIDTVPARALQIAVWKVRSLLVMQHGLRLCWP